MAKVLRIITRLNVGGPALHVIVLSDGLAGRGYRTILAAGACENEEGDSPLDLAPGREIVTIPDLARSISPVRDLRAAWRLFCVLRRERPDIVHTHTAKAGLVGRVAARAAAVPIVVHTFHGNSLSGYFRPGTSALFRCIERFLARLADCICVVSEQQRAEIVQKFGIAPSAKVRVLPLGVDLTEELRQPLPDVAGRVLRVGWLGRMVPIKGIPLLASVIDETARRKLPVQFLVAGDGPERGWLQAAAKRHGPNRLVWGGWHRDPRAFIAGCDVLMQTSANEGTPVALIQGMAAGRPFISTPAGGVVDLVCPPVLSEHAGCRWFENGVLSAPEPGSFAAALDRLIRNPGMVSSMGTAARTFAAGRFRAERLVDDMDQLYRTLVAERLQPSHQYSWLRKLTGESG